MTPLSPSSTSLNTYLLQQPTQYLTLNFQCESSFLVIVVSFLGHVVCGIFVPWLRVKFTPTALETQSLKGPPGESLQFLCSWSCTWRQYLRFNRPRKLCNPSTYRLLLMAPVWGCDGSSAAWPDTYRLALAGVLHAEMLGRQREMETIKVRWAPRPGTTGGRSTCRESLPSHWLVTAITPQLETLGQSHPTETRIC